MSGLWTISGTGRHRTNQPSLVRPYTLTAGRTDSRINLPLEAPVETVLAPTEAAALAGKRRAGQILTMCVDSPSVAEIAARLSLPLGVARVLIGDLVTQGYLRVHTTLGDSTTDRRTTRTDRKDAAWPTSALRGGTPPRRRSSSPAGSAPARRRSWGRCRRSCRCAPRRW